MSEMLDAQGTKLEMNTGDGSAVEAMDPTIGNPTILTRNHTALQMVMSVLCQLF